MNPFKDRRKAAGKKADDVSQASRDTEDSEDTDLGYAGDAGYPGGKQDLDAKTENEGG